MKDLKNGLDKNWRHQPLGGNILQNMNIKQNGCNEKGRNHSRTGISSKMIWSFRRDRATRKRHKVS